MALLPLAATPAQAGRRNLAAQKPPVSKVAIPAKWAFFDFNALLKVVSPAPVSVASEEKTVSVVVVENSPPVVADQLAQAPLAAAPRRPKGANPIVILLVPKPVASNP
ncbi:MAG TPA: hypothetical protein VHM91_02550 [Verrucomicrobiales bacterium]|nr:hypothetical protein [Verrucomicrobiales bacterium]